MENATIYARQKEVVTWYNIGDEFQILLEKEDNMLTLIRGKSRKSAYMELLHRGTNNSLLIQYGQDVPLMLPEGKEGWVVNRSEITQNNPDELKNELKKVLEQVMNETDYRYVYLYANFSEDEIDVLEQINYLLDGRLTLVASIQDEGVLSGTIVIQELH